MNPATRLRAHFKIKVAQATPPAPSTNAGESPALRPGGSPLGGRKRVHSTEAYFILKRALSLATADGYTLTMAVSSAFGINPTLYSKLPYDAIKDFAPIANLGLTPQTLVANPAAAFKSVKELVAAAKEKSGQINYASLGAGSTSHLTMEMFRAATGIQLNHVPFKGSAEANGQVIGGQIPVMFDAIPAVRPHILSGRLRGLGIATLKRSQFLPDLPTIAESGYPGFEAVGWIGIAAPAKTPAAILDKLNAEMVKIINEPDVKERLATLAFTPVGDTRAQFAAYIKSEIAKWGKAVKDSGAKVD